MRFEDVRQRAIELYGEDYLYGTPREQYCMLKEARKQLEKETK